MSRWLDMARAEEKPSMTFANIANNPNNPEKCLPNGPKVNIGNNVKWQTGLYGKPFRPVEWGEKDFQVFYEERAAVLEYDGELDRAEAERQAFEATTIHWMNLSAPQNLDNDLCAQCESPVGKIGNDAVPFLTGGGGYVWLHHGCHANWMARRRQEASKALNAMGIVPKTVF